MFSHFVCLLYKATLLKSDTEDGLEKSAVKEYALASRLFQIGIFSVPVGVTGKSPAEFKKICDLLGACLWAAGIWKFGVGPQSRPKPPHKKLVARPAYLPATKAPRAYFRYKNTRSIYVLKGAE